MLNQLTIFCTLNVLILISIIFYFFIIPVLGPYPIPYITQRKEHKDRVNALEMRALLCVVDLKDRRRNRVMMALLCKRCNACFTWHRYCDVWDLKSLESDDKSRMKINTVNI